MFGQVEKTVRALVPGWVFESRHTGPLDAVWNEATGVLNVLPPSEEGWSMALAADQAPVTVDVLFSEDELPQEMRAADQPAEPARKQALLDLIRGAEAVEDAAGKAGEPAGDACAHSEPAAASCGTIHVLSQGGDADDPEAVDSVAEVVDGEAEAPAETAATASAEASAADSDEAGKGVPDDTEEPCAEPVDALDDAAAEPVFAFWWDGADLWARALVPGFAPEVQVERFDLHRDIFSRNTGILETDLMAEKRAVILGCGSVGSLVALELARAGVGNFLLVDTDVFEYHNICRHQCGVSDVGRYKVEAVRDRILNVNPAACVECARTTAEELPKDRFDAWCVPGRTLIVGCADNRGADVYANRIAVIYGVPFISVGFWERAFAGEVFYWLPGRDLPCYECALGSDDGLSQRVEANHHIYTNQTDLEAVNFEPGISIDINFVTTIGVKLALDILNEGNPRFTQRLLPSLTQYTLVCNTNDPAVGGPMAEIFSYPLQVTTSIKVGYGAECPPCRYAPEA